MIITPDIYERMADMIALCGLSLHSEKWIHKLWKYYANGGCGVKGSGLRSCFLLFCFNLLQFFFIIIIAIVVAKKRRG